MSLVDLNDISLIPRILKNLELLSIEISEIKQQLKPKYDLRKRGDILKYLEISESTLSKYIKEGKLKQGYHYHRELKQSKSIIIFVSGAIEEFKKEKNK